MLMTAEPPRTEGQPPPLYVRISDDIQTRIEAGGYPNGKLPSQGALVREYRSSPGTVRAAVKRLMDRGLVDRRHGSGTYILTRQPITIHVTQTEDLTRRRRMAGLTGVDSWSTDIQEAGRRPSQRFECLNVAADPTVADVLDVNVGATVVVRRCWRYVDDVAASIETSYFPGWLVAELPELAAPHDITEGTTLWISEHGHPMVWHDDVVLARALTRDEAVFFGSSTALGALARTRVSTGGDRRVLRYMVSVYRSDMYQLRFGIPGDGNQEGPTT